MTVPPSSQLPEVPAGQALRGRIRVGRLRLPGWVVLAVVSLLVCGAALLVQRVAFDQSGSRAQPAPFSEPSGARPPAPSASVASPAGPSSSVGGRGLAERAAAGELVALKELEERAAERRSVEEALAIAQGRAVRKRRDLQALAQSIAENPKLAQDRAALARLHGFCVDGEVAKAALMQVARLPDPVSADMLYELWQRDPHGNLGLLAHDLLYGASVRRKWSEALEVLLELKELSDSWPRIHPPTAGQPRCQELRDLLRQAREVGDRRCLPLLRLLSERGGCGPKGNHDCYRCLRKSRALDAALAAAKKRPSPTPWILASR